GWRSENSSRKRASLLDTIDRRRITGDRGSPRGSSLVRVMSLLGQKLPGQPRSPTSALPSKADSGRTLLEVRFVHKSGSPIAASDADLLRSAGQLPHGTFRALSLLPGSYFSPACITFTARNSYRPVASSGEKVTSMVVY